MARKDIEAITAPRQIAGTQVGLSGQRTAVELARFIMSVAIERPVACPRAQITLRERETGGNAAFYLAILDGLIESVSFDVGTLGSEFFDGRAARVYVRMAVGSGANFDPLGNTDVRVTPVPLKLPRSTGRSLFPRC